MWEKKKRKTEEMDGVTTGMHGPTAESWEKKKRKTEEMDGVTTGMHGPIQLNQLHSTMTYSFWFIDGSFIWYILRALPWHRVYALVVFSS